MKEQACVGFNTKPITFPRAIVARGGAPNKRDLGMSIILVWETGSCLPEASLGYIVKPFVKDVKGGRDSRGEGGRGKEIFRR